MKNNRFVINGVTMDMGDVQLSLDLNSPMFSKVGSHSLPIRIIRTPNNENALNGNSPGVNNPAVLFLGPMVLRGEYIISSHSDYYYEGHFITDNSVFYGLVNGVLLSDLSYTEVIPGSGSLSFTEALNSAAASGYPTYNYTCFPMLAPNYYNENPFTYNQMINPWSYHPTNSGLVGFYASSSRSLTLLYAPSFYLAFVLKKLFELFGYQVEENLFATDDELKTLVVPNFNTKGDVDTTFREYPLSFSDALPPIEVSSFLEALENTFNVAFFINENDHTVRILSRTEVVKSLPEEELKLVSRLIDVEEVDGYSFDYSWDSDDDYASVSDISPYELGITIDNEEDLDDYSADDYRNQLAYVTNSGLYYLSKLTDASTDSWAWEEISKDFLPISSGDGDFSLKSEASPILTDRDYIYSFFGVGLYEYAIFPRVDLSCINNGVQVYKTFNNLRLLFYRGIVAGGGNPLNPSMVDSEYPLATPDVYRARGLTSPNRFGLERIPGKEQSLKWDGEYGLFETWWKDYFFWYSMIRRPATDRYLLSMKQLLGIDFWKKYKSGEHSLLFKTVSIEVDFAQDKVTIGDCEVYLS